MIDLNDWLAYAEAPPAKLWSAKDKEASLRGLSLSRGTTIVRSDAEIPYPTILVPGQRHESQYSRRGLELALEDDSSLLG